MSPVALWRVQLIGSLLVCKDGEPFRFRTRQQALLLARLVIAPSARREATAALLWPSACRENALAYLRRATMELRAAGLVIDSRSDGLRLASPVESDLDGAGLLSVALELRDARLLAGLDDPIADEIRRLVRHQVDTPLRPALPRPLGPYDGEDEETERDRQTDPYSALGRAVLAHNPEIAISTLIENWEAMRYRCHPERLLDFLTDLVNAAHEDHPYKPRLLLHAGWAAYLVTRYGLARQHFLAALARAECAGDEPLVARALLTLTSLATNARSWQESRGYAERAIATAHEAGDRQKESDAHVNRANLRWRVLDFDGAIADYRRAWDLARGMRDEANTRLIVTTHLTFLRVAFGRSVGELPADIRPHETPHGFGSALDANLAFWRAFERDDAEAAAAFGIRRLEASTAQSMESIFCYALDDLACLLGHLDLGPEAAACARIGARVRRQVGTLRGPGERALLRRHVAPPYFGEPVARLVARWSSDEPLVTARRIAAHLAGRCGEERSASARRRSDFGGAQGLTARRSLAATR